jgi:hypothetical protein
VKRKKSEANEDVGKKSRYLRVENVARMLDLFEASMNFAQPDRTEGSIGGSVGL